MTNPFSHINSKKLSEVFESQKQKATLGNWPIYQIFGLNMASDYPFDDRLYLGQGKTDLFFTCQLTAPISVSWDEIKPVYTSIYRTKDDKPVKCLYKQDNFFIVRYTDWADFYLAEDVIVCHIQDEPLKDTHVMNLLPNILTFWLELQEIPCLHAAAVVVNDYAVAFLANSGQGKSTLTATFLQAGYPLLTDDKLPVEKKDGVFLGRAGFPLLRIYPEVAKRLDVAYQNWDLVMPGFTKRVAHVERDTSWGFCLTPKPLAAIYLLERLDEEAQRPITTIANIPPRDAAIELIRFDFNTHINAALDFSVDRLEFFSQLARHIPVKQVTYTTGHEYLPTVLNAIIKDLQQTNLISHEF